MGKFSARRQVRTVKVKGKEKRVKILDKEKFDRFNPYVLGLGDISSSSKEVEAMAAVFDLSGFTKFCNQVDPHLAVPEYLSHFLDWLFNEIKDVVVEKSYKEGKKLYTDLPFLAKFLGDGVLFLWDTRNMSEVAICNVIVSLNIICRLYREQFYQKIKAVVVEPPTALRCGIARGKVFSVGNRQDYVGPCINIASKLQKMSHLTYCFHRRGFNIDKYMHKDVRLQFIEKRANITGVGDNELIWILKEEFEKLTQEEKKLFREP